VFVTTRAFIALFHFYNSPSFLFFLFSSHHSIHFPYN
jgi:hypothetical protein